MNPSVKSENRFQSNAGKYAAYLDTPEGRMRLDLAMAHLQEFLSELSSRNPLCALDLGCGTGAAAIRLARLGIPVVLFDSSSAMLQIAQRAASDEGMSERVTIQQGDAVELDSLFEAASFDLILCHNVLEYVDDPLAVLRGAARLLRDSSALLSVLVRNQIGEVLKAAIQSGDLDAAESALTTEWGEESLYGGKVRLFTPDATETMLEQASLAIAYRRGVRVFMDYLPPQISRAAEYERIFALERTLGTRPEFAAVARYTHCLARRKEIVSESAN
jgi:S-adenosylmethionine-dependent methyltransferase